MARDWAAAIGKVSAEGECRVCGLTLDAAARKGLRIEAAHIIDRSLGADKSADIIVPLCGPVTTTSTCHAKYDEHRLDLLPYLTLDEQLAAVHAAKGIEKARNRIVGGARL